jgi:mevalonate kinase
MIKTFGKIILLGEHAVVYDRPALALGLSDALTLESCIARPGPVRVHIVPPGIDDVGGSGTALGNALRLLQTRAECGEAGFEAVIRSDIPLGAGLGSSAALSVLLVRAMASVCARDIPDSEVRLRAHELERCFHGHPSGLDDTLAVHGGLCLFKRGGWNLIPPEWMNFRRLTPQALSLPCPPPPLVIGFSGVPRSTRAMIDRVRQKWAVDRTGTERLFDLIGACALRGADALQRDDTALLAAAISENQSILEELGLSCAAADRMIRLALGAGASAAKLTGAGGGGCVFALSPGCGDSVAAAWRSHGFAPVNARPADRETTL